MQILCFCKQFVNDLKLIDLKKTEVYLLGDFNINLLVNDKFAIKENKSLHFRNLNCHLMSKYKELCQAFSLKEIIQEPTCITSTTFSLLDHTLTNAGSFRRFSICVWQNACINTVRRAMVCNVYFPFCQIL